MKKFYNGNEYAVYSTGKIGKEVLEAEKRVSRRFLEEIRSYLAITLVPGLAGGPTSK